MGFGLTWLNWVGYAEESAVQTPYGTTLPGTVGASAPTHFIPLAGAESLRTNPNMLVSPTVEGMSMAPMKAIQGSTLVAGSIPFALVPGMWGEAGDGKLYDMTFNRATTEEGLYQLKSYTIWIGVMTGSSKIIKKITGAKVNQLTIESGEGSAFASGTLDIIAREETLVTSMTEPTPWTIFQDLYPGGAPVPEFRTGDSYTYIGTVHAAWADPTTTHDSDNISWNMTLNNKLAEDGFRNDGQRKLRRLYSTGREVTGTFVRDLRAVTQCSNFLAGTEVMFGCAFVRGSSSLKFVFPRIIYMEGSPVSEGSKDTYNKDSFSWTALGSYDSEANLGKEIVITEA